MGVTRAQFPKNGFDSRIQIVVQLIVPESQCAISPRCQERVTLGVMLRLFSHTVLVAVELDGQFCTVFDKVEKISFERSLAPEVIAELLEIAQPIPKPSLCIGGTRTQVAGARSCRSAMAMVHPDPTRRPAGADLPARGRLYYGFFSSVNSMWPMSLPSLIRLLVKSSV